MDATAQRTARAIGARTLGGLGLASTAIILAGSVLTAIPYSGALGEPYSPFNHFISELGEHAHSQFAIVFNASLVVGGAGLGLFLVLLSRRLGGAFRPVFVAAGMVAGASGTLVGVFSMDNLAIHRLVAAVFFNTGWIVVAVFSAWLLRGRRDGFSRWLLLPGAIAVASFMAFLAVFRTYTPADPLAPPVARSAVWDVPALEWAALLTLLLWFVAVSAALIGGPDRE